MAKVVCKGGIFAPSMGFVQERRDLDANNGFVSMRSLKSEGFLGQKLVIGQSRERDNHRADSVKMSLTIGKAINWWTKGLQPNMKVVSSAQDLVRRLSNAGDKLVVVGFFSPGCGGCRTLYPKICQLGEMNPNVAFLQVNYEEHKSMCHSLNVHVLPFFSFYRRAQGRVCSFSCTNATIKKFEDALAKHAPERCSLGPAKGLEESELPVLAASEDLSFAYAGMPVEPTPAGPRMPVPELPVAAAQLFDINTMAAAGR